MINIFFSILVFEYLDCKKGIFFKLANKYTGIPENNVPLRILREDWVIN